MHLTVPEALIPVYLKLSRTNSTVTNVEGAELEIRRQEMRPAPAMPPQKLPPGVTITVEGRGDVPAYTIQASATAVRQPVPAPRQSMVRMVTRGHVVRRGPGPGREVALVGEPGDVTDLDQQPRGAALGRVADRTRAEGKSPNEAMRALKRRLSYIVYRDLLNDYVARAGAGSGGQSGASTTSRTR
ncbi:hypothetical protein GCM10009638_07380 [Luteococcus sanguinis]